LIPLWHSKMVRITVPYWEHQRKSSKNGETQPALGRKFTNFRLLAVSKTKGPSWSSRGAHWGIVSWRNLYVHIYILYICGHQILSHGYINMMWVFYSIWEVLPLPGVAQMVKVGCSDQISKSCHCFLPLPIPFHRKPSVSTKCSIQSIKVSCIFYVSINTLYQPNGPSIPSR
jgi:hypothetical protein